MTDERGFSVFKLLLFLAVLAAGVIAGYKVIPVYNTYWNVQDAFDSLSRNMSDESVSAIRDRLPELLSVKYIKYDDLPPAFYDNLKIKADGNRVEISSHYHVTVWFLGPPESVDPDSDYKLSDVKGMDKLRLKARMDFDFEPHAETP